MKLFDTRFFQLFTVLFLSIFIFTSCDNSASVDDHDDHQDPFGVALILNGVEIATQENGVVTYHEGDHLELEVGEETNLIQLRWIDEDGDRFVPQEDSYSLQWIIGNEDILGVEQHSEDGKWAFHLVGKSAGETNIQFELWHNDHADFTSLPFEVHVEEVVSGMEIRNEAGESIITVNASGEVTGTIEINSGEESGLYTVVFLDQNGEALDTDHDYELEWHLLGSEFAALHASTENAFSFTVEGLSSGQAEVHFELIKGEHGDDDHGHEEEIVVYESPDILINVN